MGYSNDSIYTVRAIQTNQGGDTMSLIKLGAGIILFGILMTVGGLLMLFLMLLIV